MQLAELTELEVVIMFSIIALGVASIGALIAKLLWIIKEIIKQKIEVWKEKTNNKTKNNTH